MAANLQSTLSAMIEHRRIFFQLMDENRQAGSASDEFLISRYHQILQKSVKNLKKADQDSILTTLSHDNIQRCNLTVFSDYKSGRFLLLEWVLGMFRHFDSRRMRELSRRDLEELRRRLVDAYKDTRGADIDWQCQNLDLDEFRDQIKNLFREVASTLSSNVLALKGQAERLSETMDDADFLAKNQSQRQLQALEDIDRIYRRNVLPTLEFLDSRMDIQDDMGIPEIDGTSSRINTAMGAMSAIIGTFEEKGMERDRLELKRIHIELLQISRDVSTIRSNLEAYLPMLDEQRRLYNRIEERFTRLRDVVEQHQEGRRRGSRVSADHEIFQDSALLRGLKNHRITYSKKINWPKNMGRAMLDEYLRVSVDGYNPEHQPTDLKKRPKTGQEARQWAVQMLRIKKAMADFNIPEPGNDLLAAVHLHLLAHQLPDYSLDLVYEALLLVPEYDSGLLWSAAPRQSQIVHRSQTLRYFPRVIQPRQAEVSQ